MNPAAPLPRDAMNAVTHPVAAMAPPLRAHRAMIAIIAVYGLAAFALYRQFPANYAAGVVFDGMAQMEGLRHGH